MVIIDVERKIIKAERRKLPLNPFQPVGIIRRRIQENAGVP